MKIIKRSGSENEFDADKIVAAISKANTEVPTIERLSEEQICEIASNVEKICEDMHRALNVEEIQDLVEDQIMNKRAFALARKYITYRYNRALVRKSNSTDKQILSLIECDNEEVMQENSNKNPTVNSVQRDYMAGDGFPAERLPSGIQPNAVSRMWFGTAWSVRRTPECSSLPEGAAAWLRMKPWLSGFRRMEMGGFNAFVCSFPGGGKMTGQVI